MDMPVAIVEAAQNIDWGQVSQAVEDYKPAIQVIQKTWSRESMIDILNGRISVPDSVMNDAIANRLEGVDSVNSVVLTSHENGRVDMNIDSKKVGRIELSGTIEEMIHSGDTTIVSYKVRERALKDHGLASWFFSRISLSMVQQLFGKIELSDDLPTTIKGNTITVDMAPALAKSDLASTTIQGYRILDLFDIKSATPHDGYITFQTKMNIPDGVKEMVLNVLNSK